MSELLLKHFDLLAQAPDGVVRLRELILTLAVQGKLVPQDPSDEPASVLLQRIRAEKDRLIAEGKIKRDKPLEPIEDEDPPFVLPKSWCWTPMGAVIDIVRGITFPASEKTKEPAPGRIACLRTANVQQQIEWDDLLFVNRSFMSRDDQLLKHHDIVMSMANSKELVGKVALIEAIPQSEATFGGFLGVLRPHLIEPRFAMMVLRTPYARTTLIDSSSQTTNIANVSLGKLRPLPFPLPPANEQTRIVARVEELMRLCDALEAKRQLDAAQHAQLLQTLLGTLTDSATPEELAANWLRVAAHFDLLLERPEAVDALEQTILQLAVRGLLVPQDPTDEPASVLLQRIRAEKDRLIAEGKIKRDKPLPPITDEEKPFELPLGWEWVRLGEFSEIKGGKRLPLGHSFSSNVTPHAYIQVTNMKGGTIIDNGVKFLNLETHALIKNYTISQNDLYITIAGTIGQVGIVPPEFNQMNLTENAAKIVFLKVDRLWLREILNSGISQTQFTEKTVQQAQPKLALHRIASAVIPLPPVQEQSRIVARVAELRQLCADLRQRLTASRTTQGQLAEALVESV